LTIFAHPLKFMRKILGLSVIILFFSSCKVLSPQVMFKTKKDFPFTDSSATANKEYLLAPYDRFEMSLYSIEGFKLVDITGIGGGGGGGISYIIEKDGSAKLPILGKIPLSGFTLREAEKHLEEIYSKYYISPYIMLKVVNRQVYVFFAESGGGSIVNIPNDNMNVIEVIASVGGISENSKASRIKVIRGDPHNPQIHIINMSTIEGLRNADLSVQSHDIIYVEALPRYSNKLLVQLSPVIGLLTSALLVVNLFKK
jgi:polysaccharide export outer membrane protein